MTNEQHNHQHCLELFKQLSEYIDDELDEPVCKEIEQHLKECILCRVCFETLKRSVDICRHTETKSMPASLSKRINLLIQDAVAKEKCNTDR
ncbi:MAG: zf-HC2 domain-containing protein [Deltaproteobacteria bacterium]|nr:zf-HC2 domain-containing protein [Deltaproteobacteria bacterium]